MSSQTGPAHSAPQRRPPCAGFSNRYQRVSLEQPLYPDALENQRHAYSSLDKTAIGTTSRHMGDTRSVEVAEIPFASAIERRPASNGVLPSLLDQSLDCIKLIGRDGAVQYMNKNGLCAMEIGNLPSVMGRQWADLWPELARPLIQDALERAGLEEAVRFEAFCPTAKGSPRWWDVSVSRVYDEEGLWLGYLSVSRDVSHAKIAIEVAEIAAAEMRHRLKNSYAMIAGLLTALARGDPDREQFVSEVRDRLSALGVAQTLFVAGQHAPCHLQDLLPALLDPFTHGDCPIEVAVLPNALVPQGQADALALVIGELAVNSSKHGALTAGGKISVRAQYESGQLTIIWSETSSRPVQSHARDGGQGLRLIERILAARHGELELQWRAYGLDALIRLRLE